MNKRRIHLFSPDVVCSQCHLNEVLRIHKYLFTSCKKSILFIFLINVEMIISIFQQKKNWQLKIHHTYKSIVIPFYESSSQFKFMHSRAFLVSLHAFFPYAKWLSTCSRHWSEIKELRNKMRVVIHVWLIFLLLIFQKLEAQSLTWLTVQPEISAKSFIDRRITNLGEMDISFILFDLSLWFLLYLVMNFTTLNTKEMKKIGHTEDKIYPFHPPFHQGGWYNVHLWPWFIPEGSLLKLWRLGWL